MADYKRRIKYILIAAALLGIAALAGVFVQFRSDQGQSIPVPQSAAKALMKLAQIHQTATRDGRVEWELDAESAQLEADSGRMLLASPRIDFYTQDGSKVVLTARKGILETRSNDMQVSGNVHLRNDRYTLLTETLVYNHDGRILRSDEPISIQSKAFDLRANRMIYNLETNLARFEGNVEGILSENAAF